MYDVIYQDLMGVSILDSKRSVADARKVFNKYAKDLSSGKLLRPAKRFRGY